MRTHRTLSAAKFLCVCEVSMLNHAVFRFEQCDGVNHSPAKSKRAGDYKAMSQK